MEEGARIILDGTITINDSELNGDPVTWILTNIDKNLYEDRNIISLSNVYQPGYYGQQVGDTILICRVDGHISKDVVRLDVSTVDKGETWIHNTIVHV